ncbi:MAG: hypothetical protein K2N91_06660 [Muribaculaceae bacterium]|nr:hypothetical protein [Muribaculaceae bacterium]
MRISLAITSLICALGAMAQQPINSIEELAERLDATERYNASATYSVLLPSAPDDIVYDLNLQSIASPTDSLSPCEYLIEWTVNTPSGPSSGFSAYANASHFRFRNERLQEYHFDWDSIPFMTRDGGVQRNAQFCDLLPQSIASKVREIASSPKYKFTFTPGVKSGARDVVTLEAIESYQGYTARELDYVFDAFTGLPLKIDIESNPGAISEQTMAVRFYAPKAAIVERFAEDDLINRYPEVFEKYRQSNFRAENLPGTSLTSFSAHTLNGERFTYDRGQSFRNPTVIAMLDPSVATTAATITDIRNTLSFLPMTIDAMWIFVTNNAEQIETLVDHDNPQPGEKTLMSAKGLARDSGVTVYPTIIFVNRDGTIADIQLGYNNSLPEIVMQKTALLK